MVIEHFKLDDAAGLGLELVFRVRVRVRVIGHLELDDGAAEVADAPQLERILIVKRRDMSLHIVK